VQDSPICLTIGPFSSIHLFQLPTYTLHALLRQLGGRNSRGVLIFYKAKRISTGHRKAKASPYKA